MYQMNNAMKDNNILRIGRWVVLGAWAPLAGACTVNEVPSWDSETSAYAEFSSASELVYSFAGSPAEVTEAAVEIPLTLHLDPAARDRAIWLELADGPDNEATRFDFPAEIPVLRGETSAVVHLTLYRTPNLAVETDALTLRIIDSPTVRAGIPASRTCRVVVTDRFVQPDWWGDEYDDYYNPVGPCNDVKLRLWFETFGNFDDPRHGGRAWTGADAVIALSLIEKASMEKYGKPFHELQPTDVPLNS